MRRVSVILNTFVFLLLISLMDIARISGMHLKTELLAESLMTTTAMETQQRIKHTY